MISGNHVREEIEKAEKLVNSIKEDSLEAVIKLIKSIIKLLTVNIKITLNIRGNTKEIMDKLDIPEYSSNTKPANNDIEFAGASLIYTDDDNGMTQKIDISEKIIDNINKESTKLEYDH